MIVSCKYLTDHHHRWDWMKSLQMSQIRRVPRNVSVNLTSFPPSCDKATRTYTNTLACFALCGLWSVDKWLQMSRGEWTRLTRWCVDTENTFLRTPSFCSYLSGEVLRIAKTSRKQACNFHITTSNKEHLTSEALFLALSEMHIYSTRASIYI